MKKTSIATLIFALLVCYYRGFRRAIVKLVVKTENGASFALHLVRAFLGYLFPPILIHWWFKWPGHISQDGCQVLHNLHYQRRPYRYGPGLREDVDILTPYRGEPTKEINPLNPKGVIHLSLSLGIELMQFCLFGVPEQRTPTDISRKLFEDAPVVLFGTFQRCSKIFHTQETGSGHGGGWCCQGTDVQLQQLTPIARAGFKVVSFNYPLAPEEPFPSALVSTLRAISWLKREMHVKNLALLGERFEYKYIHSINSCTGSAGGNLITMAAALISNPSIIAHFAKEVGLKCDAWDYPEICCVASWYSILCSEHWRDADWLSSGLERVFDIYVSGIFNNRVSLLDLKNDIKAFPPTLLICGTRDPLGLAESSKNAFTMLKAKQVPVKLSLYDDTHGFIGYPVQMQQALSGGDEKHWKANSLKATNETIEFLTKYSS